MSDKPVLSPRGANDPISPRVPVLNVVSNHPPPAEKWEDISGVVRGRFVPTEEQQKTLELFKANVQDCKRPYHDDAEMMRWLIARDWDLKKATEMFTNSMEWRTNEHIDTVLETLPTTNEYFNLLHEYWPHSILSPHRFYTRDGWPVLYERFGKLDLDLGDIIPLRDLTLFHMYTIESIERERRLCVEKHGFGVGITLIQDLEGLGVDHFGPNGIKIFKAIAKVDQDNFPEGLRKVFFINTPKFFQFSWKVVKGAIDEGVAAKFSFFGGQDEYLPELTKIVALDNIPKEYGGTSTAEFGLGGSVKRYRSLAKEIHKKQKEQAKEDAKEAKKKD